LIVSIAATIAGLAMAYAHYEFEPRSLPRILPKLFYAGLIIVYVKVNTPVSWLSVFKFSPYYQLSTPRTAALFLLPTLSPIIGIYLLFLFD
jgi:hypothetical protein